MIWIDNSILESVAKCATQAIMRYGFGYTTPEGKKFANAGKLVHECHASYFSNWSAPAAMAVFDARYDALLGDSVDSMDGKDACQKENMRDLVQQYYLTHPQEYFPFEPVVEGIEKVHSSQLAEDVMFFGLVDLPVREKATGALYACDHKNRFGYISEWWTKKFSLTSQFTGYVWVLQQMYGETVPGVYINAIQMQKLPDPTSTKCKTHKVPYEQCRLQHAKAQLFISTRSPVALEKWYVQAKHLAKRYRLLLQAFASVDMVQHAPDEGRFNGACTFCDFRKWCRADRTPQMVEGMFTVDRWAPWENKN
jgi:hypothetical protein